MGKFTFTKTGIDDLLIIEPTVFGDSRGYFLETYNDEFAPYIKHLDGSQAVFVQDNQSHSRKGVLRGLHFQKSKPQGKLIRVIYGQIFDVAVDMRQKSRSFGQWFGLILSDENKKQQYVPEGFAHGFVVLSEFATFVYKCTNLYNPADEGGIIWNDSDLSIDWVLPDAEITLSEKDKMNPNFKELGFYY